MSKLKEIKIYIDEVQSGARSSDEVRLDNLYWLLENFKKAIETLQSIRSNTGYSKELSTEDLNMASSAVGPESLGYITIELKAREFLEGLEK